MLRARLRAAAASDTAEAVRSFCMATNSVTFWRHTVSVGRAWLVSVSTADTLSPSEPCLRCSLDVRHGLGADGHDLVEQLALGAAFVLDGQALAQRGLGRLVALGGLLQALHLGIDAGNVRQQRDGARLDRHAVDVVQQVARQIGAVVVHLDDVVHLRAHAQQLEGAHRPQRQHQRQQKAEAGGQASGHGQLIHPLLHRCTSIDDRPHARRGERQALSAMVPAAALAIPWISASATHQSRRLPCDLKAGGLEGYRVSQGLA
jgi:hypothetical protein